MLVGSPNGYCRVVTNAVPVVLLAASLPASVTGTGLERGSHGALGCSCMHASTEGARKVYTILGDTYGVSNWERLGTSPGTQILVF